MAPIEYLAGPLAFPAIWAAIHFVLAIRDLKPHRAFLDLPRPAQLATAFFGAIAFAVIVNWLIGDPLSERLRFVFVNYGSEKLTRPQVQFWSSLTYSITFLVGLPVAFLLWHWRDRNVRDQIDNARKDINLKEFQEVQLRAAGALDEKLPAEAREQLQIAALHQLRGFLRGEYGESFRRPAFELLVAGHAAAIHRIGVPKVQSQIVNLSNKSGLMRIEISKAIHQLRHRLTAVDRTRMDILRDEVEAIFRPEFLLGGRRFDLLDLTNKHLPRRLDMSDSHFFAANLEDAHLEGAKLEGARFEAASMRRAHLEGAEFSSANLDFADLCGAHLEDAEVWGASFECANLWSAHLEGVEFSLNQFFSTQMKGAEFNDETRLAWDWLELSPEERSKYRQILRDLGASNFDDLGSDENT